MSVRFYLSLGILCSLVPSTAVARDGAGFLTTVATAEAIVALPALPVTVDNTLPGAPLVYLYDELSVLRASVGFQNVHAGGNTSVSAVSVPGPTASWDVGATPEYWEISTTASFTGQIEVFLYYDENQVPGPEYTLHLLQWENFTWVDVTSTVDIGANRIGGMVSSLTPFVIASPEGITPVGDAPASARAALHANVPNPFNPITTIQYDVPAAGADVTIDVYDVHGARVRTLVNTHRPSGTYSVQWNGEDDRGGRAVSGVYFYRMTAGAFVETRKMVLLK